MSSTDLLDAELALICRAIRPNQFRLVIVQFDHLQMVQKLSTTIQITYPEKTYEQWNGRRLKGSGVLERLEKRVAGVIQIDFFEELLNDDSFCRSLNQRRDALTEKSIQLILLLPLGGDYLQRFSRAMPDFWSLRNLVSELKAGFLSETKGQFLTDWGRSYLSFQHVEEIEREISRLQRRIADLEQLPENQQLLAQLYVRLGKLYNQTAAYEAAIVVLNKGVLLAEAGKMINLEISAKAEKGETLCRLGFIEKAEKILWEASGLAESIDDKTGLAISLNNLSIIYSLKGLEDQALQFLQKSLAISKELDDKEGLARAFNNIGNIYQNRGDYHLALSYLEDAIKMLMEIGGRSNIGAPLNNISKIYRALGDNDKALSLLNKALIITKEVGDNYKMGITLSNTGVIYYDKAIYKKAILFFLQAANIFQKIGALKKAKIPQDYLTQIEAQIGEARYQEILSQLPEIDEI